MLVIGADELKEPLGEEIKCPKCGQIHAVQYSDKVLPDGTKQPSKLLAFYKCGDSFYLCGVNGFAI